MRFNKEQYNYWKKFTFNDWKLPYPYEPKHRISACFRDKGLTLSKCPKCDVVYESRYAYRKKNNYYKMWVYTEMPKRQRRIKECPKCKGEEVYIIEM